MNFLKTFFKGMIAGVGGVAPGLSGSVLLVILGLYEHTVHAIGTLFLEFKKNLRFLIPLIAGLGVGVLIFSKIVNFFLNQFEFYTRYAFLGLVLGTVPLFYREVKKKGFRCRHYLIIVAAAVAGFVLFGFGNFFPEITEPNVWQSVLLGVAVAGSSIVPGVDSAAILSAFGLYELYVRALAEVDWQILLPAAAGVAVGALGISTLMNLLLKNAYTLTFSVIFGLFLSVIPKILNESCTITGVGQGFAAVGFAVAGCVISFYFSDIKGNNKRIKRMITKGKS